jgi:hypothetical protein
MILTWLMLAVALALSAVAAFYSIVGLAAIFASSVVPIVIMGSILEVAKLTVTVWLHEYWDRVRWTMKVYLVPAVVVLMIITSMGIFGFLSKAHLDQAVPTGAVAAQVSLIDEKIANERETIANARTLLGQLDKAVTDISNAPDREVNGRVISSAERALQVRRSQARDRNNLTKIIEDTQARIVQLQEQKAPIASQLREVEAKVGPIKYIAALIYGDNPDANLLERAVRWMIILLVAVFDPLAIMMLLAFTESLKWERAARKSSLTDQPLFDAHAPDKEPDNGTSDVDNPTPATDMVGEHKSMHDIPHVMAPLPPTEPVEPPAPIKTHNSTETQVKAKPFLYIDPEFNKTFIESPEHKEPSKEVFLDDETLFDPPANESSRDLPQDNVVSESDTVHDLIPAAEGEPVNTVDQSTDAPVPDVPPPTQATQNFDYGDDIITQEEIDSFHSDLTSSLHFGPMFPSSPKKGDLFLKINNRPTALFKYNGEKWIVVNKELTDRYAYNDQYINWLITEISIGKYDPELLTDLEREQIKQKLNKQD